MRRPGRGGVGSGGGGVEATGEGAGEGEAGSGGGGVEAAENAAKKGEEGERRQEMQPRKGELA